MLALIQGVVLLNSKRTHSIIKKWWLAVVHGCVQIVYIRYIHNPVLLLARCNNFVLGRDRPSVVILFLSIQKSLRMSRQGRLPQDLQQVQQNVCRMLKVNLYTMTIKNNIYVQIHGTNHLKCYNQTDRFDVGTFIQ